MGLLCYGLCTRELHRLPFLPSVQAVLLFLSVLLLSRLFCAHGHMVEDPPGCEEGLQAINAGTWPTETSTDTPSLYSHCPSLSYLSSPAVRDLASSATSLSPAQAELTERIGTSETKQRVLALHTLHDAHVVYAIDSNIQWVLELERVFEVY